MSKPRTHVSSSASSRVLHAFGDEITVHLDSEATGGKLTAFTSLTPPGGGPPPHLHDNEDEWFLPLEGRVEFLLEGSWREVAVGRMVYAERGSVHAFRNVGDGALKMLIQLTPAGFERFFERCAEEFARDGGPQMERIVAIGEEHGLRFIAGD